MANSHVYAIYRLAVEVILTLVYDCVYGDCSLTDLTVADNQLTLATTDGNHRVDGFDAGLERLVHRLTENHTWSLTLKRETDKVSVYGAVAVNRFTKDVDNTSKQSFPDRDRRDFTRATHRHVFRHFIYVVEKHNTHIALLEVESDAFHAVFKLNQLV